MSNEIELEDLSAKAKHSAGSSTAYPVVPVAITHDAEDDVMTVWAMAVAALYADPPTRNWASSSQQPTGAHCSVPSSRSALDLYCMPRPRTISIV
jgi:hypothetical protein